MCSGQVCQACAVNPLLAPGQARASAHLQEVLACSNEGQLGTGAVRLRLAATNSLHQHRDLISHHLPGEKMGECLGCRPTLGHPVLLGEDGEDRPTPPVSGPRNQRGLQG